MSLVLQKLTEVEERRQQQQSSSPKSLISQVMTLPLSNLSKNVKLDFPRFKGMTQQLGCKKKLNIFVSIRPHSMRGF